MVEFERPNVALPASKVNLVPRAVAVLRRRWDEGKASGRAGRLDVRRILMKERAAFKGPNRKRD